MIIHWIRIEILSRVTKPDFNLVLKTNISEDFHLNAVKTRPDNDNVNIYQGHNFNKIRSAFPLPVFKKPLMPKVSRFEEIRGCD